MTARTSGARPVPPARPRPRRTLWLLAIVGIILAAAATVSWRAFGQVPIATTPPPAASAAGAPTAREAYRWRPVAIGGGGFVVGLAADRAGRTFVARTDVHGAYIWRPGADRWAQLATAPAMPERYRIPGGIDTGSAAIAVAPSDGRRLYMAAKGTIFHSEDRGRRWTAPVTGPFPLTFGTGQDYLRYDPALAVSPDDPGLVFAGTSFDGLWRSADGGVTWARVAGVPVREGARTGTAATPGPVLGPTPGPVLIWFLPAGKGSPRILAVSQGMGVFASGDGGRSFAPLTPAGRPAPTGIAAGAIAPDGTFYAADPVAKKLWRYRNGWTDLTADARLEAKRYVAVAVNPSGGEVIAFEHNGRAWRSGDGGERWSRLRTRVTVGDKDPPWLRIANHPFFATAQVMYDPVVPNRLWIAAGTGVFYADAAPGALWLTWISRTRGIEELVTNDVVQPPGHAPLFAAWDFGIHVRADLDAWSTAYGPKERVLIAAQQLALTPADREFVVTNASDTRTCCAEDGDAVLAGYSEDAGRTWRKFATLPTPPGTRADDPWRMAFGGIAVSSGDPDNIVWMPSYDRAPFFTRDRGGTWAQVHFPGEVLPFTGSHPAKHLQRKVLVADPVKGGTFYLAHSGTKTNPALVGVWRTTDGGATWARRSTGEVAPSSGQAAKLRAVPGREGDLFFTSAVASGPDVRLRRSRDGGATWSIVPGIDHVDDVAFGAPPRGRSLPTIFLSGFVGGRYGIWRSIDDGARWHRIAGLPLGTLDRVTVLGADPDVFGRVYIGLMGSGWLYGEPAPCRPAPLQAFAAQDCFAVEAGTAP